MHSIQRAAAILAFTLSAVSYSAPSKASVETPLLFNCSVSFSATGRSAYLGVGYTSISGKGTMTCYDYLKSTTEQIPLKVTIKGPGAGLGITGLSISGGQAGIGLHTNPDALLGRYLVIRGNAAAGAGGALSSGIRIGNGAFYLTVQIEGTTGLGFGIDVLSFEIERDSSVAATTTLAVAQQSVQTATVVAVSPVSTVERVKLNQTVEVVDEAGNVIGRYKFIKQ